MSRKSYQKQLADLQDQILEMSTLALSQFDDAIRVIETNDPEAAQAVVDGDHELNELYLEVESDCIGLLALQQPVAGDLRMIAASFKIITDLERVGDLAVNLAQYAQREDTGNSLESELEPIASVAREMIEDAMHAYETEDPDACRAIYRRDDELDTRCRAAGEAIVRGLLAEEPVIDHEEQMRDAVSAASRALLTIRDIERVGDHAVNIAARTYYMIENDDELIY